MLRRINNIQNVGLFTDCSVASVPFAKWTVIYGRNTYGKSTLADVFGSLARNDPTPIINRKSIPESNKSQIVELSFSSDGENEGAGKAKYKDGKWLEGLRESHKLIVYDDTFYHSHLFASQKFTRDTKTQFSSFILGESGVDNAIKIASKKKERDQIGRQIREFENSHFKDVKPINDFIQLKVTNTLEDLNDQRGKLAADYQSVRKQLSEISEIRGRKQTAPLKDLANIFGDIDDFNSALKRSIDSAHQNAQALIDSHIKNNIHTSQSPMSWFREGLGFGKGENCQYCGQSLNTNALNLIQAYSEYFNESYRHYLGEISISLDLGASHFKRDYYSTILLTLEENSTALGTYPELHQDAEFQQLLTKHEEFKSQLKNAVSSILSLKDNLLDEFTRKAEEKKQSPHEPITTVDVNAFKAIYTKLTETIEAYNTEVTAPINKIIETFKRNINATQLSERLEAITADGTIVGRKIKRLERNSECEQYTQLKNRHEELAREIPELEEQLQAEQSRYIDMFFEKINQNFNELGSSDFHLVKGWDRNGHTPICYLQVNYKGEKVKESNLDKVFSESDRRSLSLSLFFAKLESLEESELSKTVLVFDDPVTSFDEHRVSTTHSKIAEISERAEQVILLSHFREGISRLLRKHLKDGSISVLEIKKGAIGSKIIEKAPEDLMRSIHERMREQIFNFIDRKLDSVEIPLRVFLEEELKMRFAKQFRENSLSSKKLSVQIEGLYNSGAITEYVYKQLNIWRNDMNADHHTFSGDDIEDKRNTARRFMDFLYLQLAPSSPISQH